MDSKMLSTMSIAAEKAGESPEPAPTASSAQQAPGRPGLPEIALYVHTAKDTHLPSMGPPSANSDVQSPHHMMTAVSTGSAFGSMMMLDPSRNFLQGFRCCNRTFDDLFQLLSHQAAGNCASDKMSVGDPESTVEPRGETSFATQSSQEGSSTMGSLSSFVAVDSVTPKVEAAEEFEPPIEAPQEQSAPDLQLQEHGHIPAATHVQHHVPAAHALPIAAPAIVSHPPMLLATLPDGRSVLVPVGPGGQIPTIAGTLPMPMAADGHGSYAHSPFSNHSSTGMSPLYEEDGREAGHGSTLHVPRARAPHYRRRSASIERQSNSPSPSTILQNQVLQQQREHFGQTQGYRSLPRSYTEGDGRFTFASADAQFDFSYGYRATSPGQTSSSIPPASPGSDLSGGLTPGLYSTTYEELHLGSHANGSTKATPYLAGLDIKSDVDSVHQVHGASHGVAALGLMGIPPLPGAAEVQVFHVQEGYGQHGAASGNHYGLPLAYPMTSASIDPSKLFGSSDPLQGSRSAESSPPRKRVQLPDQPATQPASPVLPKVEDFARPSKRKSTGPVGPGELETEAQKLVLREKDHFTASPTSSPSLTGKKVLSRTGSLASLPGSPIGSPALGGTPKKKKPNEAESVDSKDGQRKTSVRGFTGAVNLFSLGNVGTAPEALMGKTAVFTVHPPLPVAPLQAGQGINLVQPVPQPDQRPGDRPNPDFSRAAVPARPAGPAMDGEPGEKVRRKRPKKRYICTVDNCGKEYKNLGGLKYHKVHFHKIPLIRRSEMPEDDKPYQCPVSTCPRGYGSAGGLKYHMAHAHSPEEVEEAVRNAPKRPARLRHASTASEGSRASGEWDDDEEEDEDEDGVEEYSEESSPGR